MQSNGCSHHQQKQRTEVKTSINVTDEMVTKFVMNQRRGAVDRSAMHPTRQVFVQLKGKTRAVEVGRDSAEERINGLWKRWATLHGGQPWMTTMERVMKENESVMDLVADGGTIHMNIRFAGRNRKKSKEKGSQDSDRVEQVRVKQKHLKSKYQELSKITHGDLGERRSLLGA